MSERLSDEAVGLILRACAGEDCYEWDSRDVYALAREVEERREAEHSSARPGIVDMRIVDRNAVLRLLCSRFWASAQAVSEGDYPRLEELAYLVLTVMYGAGPDLDRPVTLRGLLVATLTPASSGAQTPAPDPPDPA